MAAQPVLPAETLIGKCLGAGVFWTLLVLLARLFLLVPVEVVSGSMAPALLGPHRRVHCPVCEHTQEVGLNSDRGPRRSFEKGFAPCRGCGASLAGVREFPIRGGDQVLVNRLAYLFGTPGRWDVVVFRMLGEWFVKRLIGLPGEEVLLRSGDLFIDGELLRKNFEWVEELRLPLIQRKQGVRAGNWEHYWEGDHRAGESGKWILDGRSGPSRTSIGFFCPREGKCLPALDESPYAGDQGAGAETVHDFSARLEILALDPGIFRIALFDGRDEVAVDFPCGTKEPPAQPAGGETAHVRRGPTIPIHTKLTVDVAFVDRRFQARVNGKQCFEPLDLPAAPERKPVVRPIRLVAQGCRVEVRDFVLFRDIHFRQAGRNAVAGRPVLLGRNEYFVLGDNSPASEDSRFWPGNGAVSANRLVGRVFFHSTTPGGIR